MGVLGLGREAHFSEFNDPLDVGSGVVTPLARKNAALANLGLAILTAAGGAQRMQMPVPATATDTATLTTAQLLNGSIQGTPTAAANYTLPLATALDTALPADFAVGEAFEFSIINQATNVGFDITIVTNTGWTLSGAAVVIGAGPNDGTEWKSGVFRARKTGAGAWTLYRLS